MRKNSLFFTIKLPRVFHKTALLPQFIMTEIMFRQIGVVRTPYTTLENMPIQPKGAKEVCGTVEVHPDFTEGLADLGGFSHAYLIYHFHEAKKTALKVVPFMDTVERGVFSTRSPARPNHIGISIVEIEKVEGNIVHLRGVDILDGTPLLDIKPFIDAFDYVEESSSGWMTAGRKEVEQRRSDKRFT